LKWLFLPFLQIQLRSIHAPPAPNPPQSVKTAEKLVVAANEELLVQVTLVVEVENEELLVQVPLVVAVKLVQVP
jgi:hypothetical protein